MHSYFRNETSLPAEISALLIADYIEVSDNVFIFKDVNVNTGQWGYISIVQTLAYSTNKFSTEEEANTKQS